MARQVTWIIGGIPPEVKENQVVRSRLSRHHYLFYSDGMRPLRVALLQLFSNGLDIEANLCKGEHYCREARRLGADIALFPEMWSIGYTFPSDLTEWSRLAVSRTGPFVTHFMSLAGELEMAIGLTYLEQWPGAPRNSLTLIDGRGEPVLTYAKVHTLDDDVEAACTPGDGFHVATLSTAVGEVTIGAMICYDREFPESARVLMLKGAELILTPNACRLDDIRINQFQARAFENMVAVAMANYASYGHSIAFSPVVYDDREERLDPLLVEAGAGEGVFLADFDLDSIRAYRSRAKWGNAFRKPAHYGLLTSGLVSEPFIRQAAR
ncbi:carbon-nitrogen hydrolase family protein [Nonomuraea sp. NPDC050227]|uniref:carbon-nitrogen hydrolase family protein n=1 Tax=Nonomuraea sp. NPDC050227 TaxID=3364360 RepID=UPI003795BCFB